MSEWLGKPYTCQWEKIPGWFGFKDCYDEAVAKGPQTDGVYIEIGVAFGRSVAYLHEALRKSGKTGTIYAIDPWVDDWWMPPNDYPLDAPRPTWGGEYAEQARALGGPFRAFLHYMTAHAPEALGEIRVIRQYSQIARRMFADLSADLVMIDGNHNYEAVKCDIDDWRTVARTDGIFAGDDYSTDFPGVMRAVGEVYGRPNSAGDFEVRGTTWIRRIR